MCLYDVMQMISVDHCGLSKDVLMDECKICSSKITKSIKESIEKRKVCASLHRYLKKMMLDIYLLA
jgi:hypothetical protein